MKRPSLGREGLVLLILIVVGASWLAVESARGVLDGPMRPPLDSSLFVERAVFCPSAPQGSDASAHVTAGPIDEDPVLMEIEPREEDPVEIQDSILTDRFDSPTDLQVISYGRIATASTTTFYRSPVQGLAASPCSNSASRRWLFPAGSSAQGYNEQLVFFNPFPDEAVVRVSFVTPGGVRSKANLANVAVPSGGSTTVKLNRFILQQPVLGADVTAIRGRIVARKTLFSNDDDRPSGVGATLGAREASTEWFFPLGGSGKGIEERISIMNVTDDEALITISLVGDEAVEQPADLVEIPVGRQSTRSISLSKALGGKDIGGMSAIVRSENEVPIYAERALWYDTEDFQGFSLELGSPRASASWWLGPAGAKPTQDSIIVLNVGQEEASLEIEVLVAGTGPDKLVISDLKVPAGGRLRIPLTGKVAGTSVALLRSSSPVVAERVGYSSTAGDVAALMGIPIE